MISIKTTTPHHPYPKEYLPSLYSVHRFLFKTIAKEYGEDFDRALCQYMHSDLKAKMDKGVPSALNAGIKQLLSSSRIEKYKDSTYIQYDEGFLNWISDIFLLMQWQTGIKSSEIIDTVPIHELQRQFLKLYEKPLSSAVSEIYKMYFEKE